MRCVNGMKMVIAVTVAGVLVTSAVPREGQAQELADYDYENLSFRGISFDVGYLYADKVEDTRTLGVRFDLGFLGPGFRLMPGVTYWSPRWPRPRWMSSRLDSASSQRTREARFRQTVSISVSSTGATSC